MKNKQLSSNKFNIKNNNNNNNTNFKRNFSMNKKREYYSLSYFIISKDPNLLYIIDYYAFLLL